MMRKMGRLAWRGTAALAAAALLALALGLGGCLMGRHEVTERDVEVARQMGAPAGVMETLGRGRWPSDKARYKVRNAEACIDYLSGRYGLELSAVSATGGAKWMTHSDDVVLRIESGPHAGEEVSLEYDAGVRGGRQEMEPVFYEDCFYVVNHEEWERIASDAVAPVLAGLPEGSWLSSVRMDGSLYSADQIDRPITEGGGTGTIQVSVSMEACGLDEAGLEEFAGRLAGALEGTGLRGSWRVSGYADAESAAAISSGTRPSTSRRAWTSAQDFGV